MVLLPLFFLFVIELLAFWKFEGRMQLAAQGDRTESQEAWVANVESSSSTYWAVFLVCLVFAGLLQWIEVCLIPLVNGSGEYAIDWATLAIVQPDLISMPEALMFTGLSYLYMAICFYIFFVGLILLFTIAHDFWKIRQNLKILLKMDDQREFSEVGLIVMRAIFRCTVLGILVAICMKGQSSYLTSTDEKITTWLVRDMSSAFYGPSNLNDSIGYRMPTHYSSFLVVISTCIVFLFGALRLGSDHRSRITLWKMSLVVALLVTGYLFIGVFAGFSILLGAGALFALYGLLDPGFDLWRASESGTNLNAS